jgi:hypothetical protein
LVEAKFRLHIGSMATPGSRTNQGIRRLRDKEHHGEQQPHRDHRMHPPISGIPESIPEIEPTEHVEARKPRQHRPDSRLLSEPPLDGIKESHPFVWRLEAANARKQDSRYKTHSADPQDD